MSHQPQQQTLDEMAAEMALSMDLGTGKVIKSSAFPGTLAKGGAAGDLPTGRGGAAGAEGGFTPQAGGQVIDAHVSGGDAAKAFGGGAPNADQMAALLKAGALTGDQVTNASGRQGSPSKTTDDVTNEPKGELGGGAGEGGNLETSADGKTRKRQSGKTGISGGPGDGGQPGEPGLPQQADGATRSRKKGKVGLSKAELGEQIAKAQENLAAAIDLYKAMDEDDDDDEDEVEKGGELEVYEDELIKSLDLLENIAAGTQTQIAADRAEELAKGLEAGTLSAEQMIEFADLMKAAAEADDDDPLVKGGDIDDDDGDDDDIYEVDGDPLHKSYVERLEENPEMAEGFDASPFLRTFAHHQASEIDSLHKSLAAQRDQARQVNVQLAKSLKVMARANVQSQRMIKSLADRLETVENQPLPRVGGAPSAAPLQKSLPNEVGQGVDLSFEQIGDTIVEMAMRGDRAPCGEGLQKSMAEFESTGHISPALYKDVVAWRSQNRR